VTVGDTLARVLLFVLEGVQLIVRRSALAPVAGVASGHFHAYVNYLTATAGVGGVAIAGWELSSSTTTAVSSVVIGDGLNPLTVR
jgi:hypothetical protein